MKNSHVAKSCLSLNNLTDRKSLRNYSEKSGSKENKGKKKLVSGWEINKIIYFPFVVFLICSKFKRVDLERKMPKKMSIGVEKEDVGLFACTTYIHS